MVWNAIFYLVKMGCKHHIVVDKNGFLIVVMGTIANIHDSKAAFLLMRVLNSV